MSRWEILRVWLMGKLGRAWVGARVGAWVHGWMHGGVCALSCFFEGKVSCNPEVFGIDEVVKLAKT